MEKSYWQERWDKKEIGFNQATPNVLLQKFFNNLSLKPGSRILVPLCGKSIDMLWLVEQGMQVIGIELSEQACLAFFEENDLAYVKETTYDGVVTFSNSEITLYSGDFFTFTKDQLGNIDDVYDRAALIALPKDLRTQYVSHLKSLLLPTTQLILLTTSYDQETMQGPPFSVVPAEVNALYGSNMKIEMLYDKPFTEISEHLYEKGLRAATEYVFKGKFLSF